uniref:Uncharacterized protein n=1 Tax=Rhizophora mucronata TaxID=61149 RepID=A0A2P2NZF3_RHIMU
MIGTSLMCSSCYCWILLALHGAGGQYLLSMVRIEGQGDLS